MYRFFNDDIMNAIDYLDNDYDIIFTSPPYNVEKMILDGKQRI